MITPDDVRHLFELAKIEASSAELERFPREINAILEYVDVLRQAPLGDAAPTLSFAPENGDLRSDESRSCASDVAARIKDAFPAVEKGYVKTKKVFGGDEE